MQLELDSLVLSNVCLTDRQQSVLGASCMYVFYLLFIFFHTFVFGDSVML